MKRAAIERLRTYRVWKQHHDDHVKQDPGKPVACVCDLQVNRFRKGQRRFGCGQPRCYMCHGDKLFADGLIEVRIAARAEFRSSKQEK